MVKSLEVVDLSPWRHEEQRWCSPAAGLLLVEFGEGERWVWVRFHGGGKEGADRDSVREVRVG